MAPRLRDDGGATLIEVLVAVLVLGTAGVALLGGLFSSVAVSDTHRKETTAAAVAHDYSERIAGATYVECATPSAYSLAPAAVPVPAGYAASVDVAFWTGAGWAATCSATGLQRVTVLVSSNDGRATERSVVVVRQR